MIIIGNQEEFAVKIKVSKNPTRWIWGNICLIVNNIEIGDFTSKTSLSTATSFFYEAQWNKDQRSFNSYLYKLNDSDFYSFLQKKLYCVDDRSFSEIEDDELSYGMHIAFSSGIDILDGWKGYIIEYDKARLLIRFPNNKIQSFYFKNGVFDKVMASAADFLDKLCQKHRVNNNTQEG